MFQILWDEPAAIGNLRSWTGAMLTRETGINFPHNTLFRERQKYDKQTVIESLCMSLEGLESLHN